MSPHLDAVFQRGRGSRTVVILESFPFFMTGRLLGKEGDIVIIEAQEGVPIQLVGRVFHIRLGGIAAFFIENEECPIPVLEPGKRLTVEKQEPELDLNRAVEEVKKALHGAVEEIKAMLGEAVGEKREGPFGPAGEMKKFPDEAYLKTAELELRHLERDVLFVLRPKQLSILGQVFRPIMVARLEKIGVDFVFLKNVNIRFSNAPDFIFPLPLFVPKNQIALFLPFEREVQFPLV